MRTKTHLILIKVIASFVFLFAQCSTVFANFQGVAETYYNGPQVIMCDTCPPGNPTECPKGMFRLWEVRETTPGNSVIINTKRTVAINGSSEFLNSNADWTSGSWNLFDRRHQAALDVHFATGLVLDYFSIVHNRNGVDDGKLTYKKNILEKITSYCLFEKNYLNYRTLKSKLLSINIKV